MEQSECIGLFLCHLQDNSDDDSSSESEKSPYLSLSEYECVHTQHSDDLLPQHLTTIPTLDIPILLTLRCSVILASVTYHNVDSWPDVKSLPTPLGEIGGIALNARASELVVFHRGSRKWESK